MEQKLSKSKLNAPTEKLKLAAGIEDEVLEKILKIDLLGKRIAKGLETKNSKLLRVIDDFDKKKRQRD